MSLLPALPPPSSAASASSPSGLAKLKQMLMSDAVAVTPIKPIPGEQDQKNRRRDSIDATDDAVKRGARESDAELRTRSRESGGAGGEAFTIGGGNEAGPVTPPLAPATAGPTTGFVTQSIAQEAVGAGLHIEPWSAAIGAYRRADAGPSDGPLVSNVTV